ncbi:MAG: tRNA pseudouridine(38-40) synthase TruA [Gammaproteobacteria bacterium]
MTSRIAAGLEYDGGAFRGWQSQACGGGVQDAVQNALAPLNGKRITVHAAGRTDAGTHAAMQIAHFDAAATRPEKTWARAANAVLPPQISVLWAHAAPPDFHARYSATRRHYQYAIFNAPVPSPLRRNWTAYCRAPLCAETMQNALSHLCGLHDFSAFRASSCQAKTPVRTMHAARAKRQGEIILLEFCADGFLQCMVRNIAGAVLEIGANRRPPQWLGELLEKKDRNNCPPPAPAAGLYFTGAEYPKKFNFIPPPVSPPSQINLSEINSLFCG